MAETNRDRIIDEYDRRAYDHIVKTLERTPGRARRAVSRAGEAIGSAGHRVADRVPEVARDAMEAAVTKTLEGFQQLIVEPSLRSVMISKIEKRYRRLGHPVETLADISKLPLYVIDKAMPPLGLNYALATAGEGAVAGGVVTGAELLATFGTVASAGVAAAPSLGVVAGAMATDAAVMLAASMRVIAHVGAFFGHDLQLPEEQVFALSVVNWSGAGTGGSKVLAFQQLSRITQQLVRNAAWRQLEEHLIVEAIQKATLKLGFSLTKRKLGQAIPVAGVLVGAGLNAQIIHALARDARTAYRLRHLMETYGLDPSEFSQTESTLDGDLLGLLDELEFGPEGVETDDDEDPSAE